MGIFIFFIGLAGVFLFIGWLAGAFDKEDVEISTDYDYEMYLKQKEKDDK